MRDFAAAVFFLVMRQMKGVTKRRKPVMVCEQLTFDNAPVTRDQFRSSVEDLRRRLFPPRFFSKR